MRRLGELVRGADYRHRAVKARSGAQASPKGRFAMIPFALVNDLRLSAEAIRAFAVLRDVEYDGVCKISLRRLGQRLGRTDQAARRVIRSLKETGWLEAIDETNGRSCIYRLQTPITHNSGLLTTPITGDSGSTTQTPITHDGGLIRTPISGDPGPLSSMTQTPITSDSHTIRSLDSLLKSDRLQKNDGEDDGDRDKQLPHRLGDLYTDSVKNGNERGGKQNINLDAELPSPSEAVA